MEKESPTPLTGRCRIYSSYDHKVLDICGGIDFKPGETNVIFYDSHCGLNQQWKFNFLDDKYFTIATCVNENYVITVKDPKNVVLDSLKEDDEKQIFYYKNIDERDFFIVNKYYEAPLNISIGCNIHCSESKEDNKKFYYKERHGYNIVTSTNQVLDCSGGSADEGTDILSWSAYGGKNQVFYLFNKKEDIYFIQTANGETVITLGHEQEKGRSKYVLQKDVRKERQLFKRITVNGKYLFKNLETGGYLISPADGNPIVDYRSEDEKNIPDGLFHFKTGIYILLPFLW